MSIQSRGGAASRIASLKARERALAIADRSEEYMPNSNALAAEALVASHPHPKAGQHKATATQRRHTRSVWLLVGWLVVSVSMIAGAGGVIAKYF